MPVSENSRALLEIDAERLKENFRHIREHVNPLNVLGVIKADAYGLGICNVAPILKESGVQAFGVAEIDAALKLKSLGLPIHIMGSLFEDEVETVVQEGFIAPVTSLRMAEVLNETAQALGKKASCQFKIDTGMGRVGILESEVSEVIRKAARLPFLECRGIYSHFPAASGDSVFSKGQIAHFLRIVDACRAEGIEFELIHMANSDALHVIPEALRPPFTMVRTGLNLYGLSDMDAPAAFPLMPVVSLKTRLVSVRRLPAGASIGYNRTVLLERPTLIGTVPLGYADGLPFGLPGSASFMVRGRKCPVTGRISMDMTTICLEDVPDAAVGDEVVCFGEGLPVEEWARINRSVVYQVLCGLGPRIERRVI